MEQAQVMGLQQSHAEIRDEMTGIREQLNTLMQRMQRNNLQPNRGKHLGCHEMILLKLTKIQIGMMRLMIGSDQEGRIIILLMV